MARLVREHVYFFRFLDEDDDDDDGDDDEDDGGDDDDDDDDDDNAVFARVHATRHRRVMSVLVVCVASTSPAIQYGPLCAGARGKVDSNAAA